MTFNGALIMELKNCFTIDVEDYFHVEAFSSHINVSDWDKYPCNVENNTHRILDLLDNKKNTKATFFILGWVAKRYPSLVRKIHDNGHEIASHGMSHQLIYNQDIKTFTSETSDAKNLLEDIIQNPVNGYRAATYSITNKSLWALDVLLDLGFRYDSSIFPMRHDRYGISDIYPYPHLLETPSGRKIVEFPISTVKEKLFTLPVAGGGYFRLFPYFITKAGLKRINKKGHGFVFYIHPWEIDTQQPRIDDISYLTKFRHYNNIQKTESRLNQLLSDFEFTTMHEVLEYKKLLIS